MVRSQNKLAIIIPAFKTLFLKQALDSLSSQLCKDFTLYIGDDASQEDIVGIVREYEKRIDIVYHRFDKNLGGESLTRHWDRCVALSKNEPYVLLFADDDEMSPNVVSCFYTEIEKAEDYNLFKYDLNIINEKGETIQEFNYPDLQDIKDFFRSRIHESIYSCITQYIFKRSEFKSSLGFVSFPLAWFSDDASVIKFAGKKCIKKISGALIKWRFAEDINITSSRRFEREKARATFEYVSWFNKNLNEQFDRKELKELTWTFLSKRMLKMPMTEYYRLFSIKTIFVRSGFFGGLYLCIYDAYCRIRMTLEALR